MRGTRIAIGVSVRAAKALLRTEILFPMRSLVVSRASLTLRIVTSAIAAVSALAVAREARAQDSAQPAPPASAASAAPAAPPAAAASTAISRTCTLGTHPGIEDADAQTSADVVCHELDKRGVTGNHEVRLGKLGGRVLVVTTTNGGEERRFLVNSLEELPTAATRLGDAEASGRSFEDAQKVDTVVGVDTRTPKVKPGQMGFKGGVLAAMPVGAEASPSPGIALGLLYRANRFGIDSHLRVGVGGDSGTTHMHVVLGTGPVYYFSDGDFSPYIGAGLGWMSFKLKHDGSETVGASGVGAYAEAGVEFLRTNRASFTAGIRADIPFFPLTTSGATPRYDYMTGATTVPKDPSDKYVVPVSLMVGMLFH